MTDDQRNSLDSFEFFFRSEFFSLQLDLILFNVILLNCEELKVAIEFLKLVVKVLFFGLWTVDRFGAFKAGKLDLHETMLKFKYFLNFIHFLQVSYI